MNQSKLGCCDLMSTELTKEVSLGAMREIGDLPYQTSSGAKL